MQPNAGLATRPEVQQLNHLDPKILEALIVNGDCKNLTTTQRVQYYSYRCSALGLDPNTQPFEYVNLNGKLVLYAKAATAQQLVKSRGLSVEITSQQQIGDSYVVFARVTTLADSRKSENMGAVPTAGLKGEALTNAMMKAVTKAIRRAVLAHEGLGMLDETEVDSIPGAQPEPVRTEPKVIEGRPGDWSPEPVAKEGDNFIWTEADMAAIHTALDVVSGLVGDDKLAEIQQKIKQSRAEGEDPSKVLNRLTAFIDRAASAKKKVGDTTSSSIPALNQMPESMVPLLEKAMDTAGVVPSADEYDESGNLTVESFVNGLEPVPQGDPSVPTIIELQTLLGDHYAEIKGVMLKKYTKAGVETRLKGLVTTTEEGLDKNNREHLTLMLDRIEKWKRLNL